MRTTMTPARPLVLRARTAAELMSANPVSIRQDATTREAEAFLCDRGFTAAPVTDDAGRPVGVISRTDLLIHERAEAAKVPEYFTRAELDAAAGEHLPAGFEVERVDRTLVNEVMTPMVFGVPPDASVKLVVDELLALNVHRLFVIDEAGVLIGVVTTTDVLRHLAE
jgi:CBS domain-containing protein